MPNQTRPRASLVILSLAAAALLAPPQLAAAADLDSLHFLRHGGAIIEEGDTVERNDLSLTHRFWDFEFSWPRPVFRRSSFLGVFRGTFGDLEGGVPERGVNYAYESGNRWGEGDNRVTASLGSLPALGELDNPSGTYTAVVAEKATDSSLEDIVEWFATGGASGVEPANHATLTFFYDSTPRPENLDSLNSVEYFANGETLRPIRDGDTVASSTLHYDTQNGYIRWVFDFDWPHEVDNLRAMFSLFRGTFGNVEGDTLVEAVNYDRTFQVWRSGGNQRIPKSLRLPIPEGETAVGTYTFMVAERDPKYSDPDDGFSELSQIEWFASGGAEGIPPLRYSLLTFHVSDLDPLLRQYEPVLYLHPEENYQPMNIEAFVEVSALWDDNDLLPDTVLEPRGEVAVDDISVGGSEDWYLAFSSDEAKTFDVANALSTYNQLVSGGEAVPTYYGYKTEDSFVDDEGSLHEFIVLQYWYFYAFNDWLEHGGFNNHEGDWETVMVFLDKATEEPQYVAYSTHHNEGEPNQLLGKFDSVRRDFDSDEVVKDGEQVVSFVSLGSHANYPNNGSEGVHTVPTPSGPKDDLTSLGGTKLNREEWEEGQPISGNKPDWMLYEGRWGADSLLPGFKGPFGPNFNDISGNIRFHNPVEWAGIDKAATKTVSVSTATLDFLSQLASMLFSDELAEGTEVSVDLHDENISFGSNLDLVTLLPHFWDIGSSLDNGTFEVEVAFQYDQAETGLLGIEEDELGVFLYDESTNLWTHMDSTVDTTADTISFITSHFSRYAIGVEISEQTLQEQLQAFRDYVEDSDIKKGYKNRLIVGSRLAEKFIEKGLSTPLESQLRNMKDFIKRKKGKGISEEDADALFGILQSIKDSI